MKKFVLLALIVLTLFGCSDDDNNNTSTDTIEPKAYKIQFWGYSSSEVQYPLTVTYYKDNQQGVLSSELVSSQTNTDVIETRTLTSYDKLGFKLAVGNSGQATINTVIITDMETNEVILDNSDLEVNTGQTFMYDVSDDNYTIQ
jgi:uncharacterized protein YcfL